jgi:hypothetical protein
MAWNNLPQDQKKLDKFLEWSKNCMVTGAGGGEYKVSSTGGVFTEWFIYLYYSKICVYT